jgi:hypothetical protein
MRFRGFSPGEQAGMIKGIEWGDSRGELRPKASRRAHRHFQERSALRRHPANHGQAPKPEAQKANSRKEAGSGTAVGTVMALSSRVTAAFIAKARPNMLAPVFRVMLWSARILP